jgi:hypothetical protein
MINNFSLCVEYGIQGLKAFISKTFFSTMEDVLLHHDSLLYYYIIKTDTSQYST